MVGGLYFGDTKVVVQHSVCPGAEHVDHEQGRRAGAAHGPQCKLEVLDGPLHGHLHRVQPGTAGRISCASGGSGGLRDRRGHIRHRLRAVLSAR